MAALVAAWRFRPTIKLRRDDVRIAASPDEVFGRLRDRMLGRGRSWPATGGAGTTVTFRHLQGPLHRCEEALHVEPDAGGGTTIAHEGELAMPGGLFGCVFGVATVRPVFERHVAAHFRQLSAADRSG